MRKDVSGKVELAVRPLPYSETWRPTPPDKPGVWWMLAGECEGEPELVRVDRRRGELWAIDCAVGSLPAKMYHDGLMDCMWQEAKLLQ